MCGPKSLACKNSHTGSHRVTFPALVASFCRCSHVTSTRRGQNQNETHPRNKTNFVFFLTPFIFLHPKHPMAVNCLLNGLAVKPNSSLWFEKIWRGKIDFRIAKIMRGYPSSLCAKIGSSLPEPFHSLWKQLVLELSYIHYYKIFPND